MVRKGFLLLGVTYFFVSVGQNLWRATFQNIAIESLHLDPLQMGIAFSIVSIPGLLSVLLGIIGAKIRLLNLLAFSFLLIGTGLVGTGFLSSAFGNFETMNTAFVFLSCCLVLLHSGFAAYYPSINTIFLLNVEPQQTVRKLGCFKSMGPLAGVFGTALFLLIMAEIDYATKLAAVGVSIVLVGIFCVKLLPSKRYIKKQRMLRLKRSLLPYYLLNFLNGCRSSIFKTFVIYYLITEYGFELKHTAAIVLSGNFLTFLGYQTISWVAKRYDPANLLAFLYLVMFFNFIGFMWIKDIHYLSLIYLLDSFVFCTSAITDGYLKFISRGKELLGDLSIGVSLYHLGGVLMPVFGALLYNKEDVHVFMLGSLCAILAMVITRKLTGIGRPHVQS